MTYNFQYMLYLACCGATGATPSKPVQEIEWNTLYRLASQQAVLPLVAYAVKIAGLSLPSAVKTNFQSIIRNTAVNVTIRKLLMLEVLERLDRQGVHVKIIKGFAVADSYAVPECRYSSDIDILVAAKDEKRTYALLVENGFSIVHKREKTAHEGLCTHPIIGSVEVHVMLYGARSRLLYFDGITMQDVLQEDEITISSQDGVYHSLGHTDHLIFLFMHAMKHFITSGMNIRMLLDVVLFYRKNKLSIDDTRVCEFLERINGQRLFSVFVSVIEQYGNVETDLCCVQEIEENVSAFLSDLELCKGMNYLNADRKHNANQIERYMINSNKNKRSIYIRAYLMIVTFIRYGFPPLDYMRTKYPLLHEKPYLLPLAWFQRLFQSARKAHTESRHKEIISPDITNNEEIKRRMHLFAELEITRKLSK